MEKRKVIMTTATVLALSAAGFFWVESDKLSNQLDELNSDLDKELELMYENNATTLLAYSWYGDIVALDNYCFYKTTISKDSLYTTGEDIYNFLIDHDIKCLRIDNTYYSKEGGRMRINKHDSNITVTDAEINTDFNGTSLIVDTKKYEELLEYDMYYDIIEGKKTTENGKEYNYATRKLIRKN